MEDNTIFERFSQFWKGYQSSGLYKTLSIAERMESKRAAWCAWQATTETKESDHTPIHNSLDAGDEDGIIAQKIYQNLVERVWTRLHG